VGHFVSGMFGGGTFGGKTSCTGVLALNAYKCIPLDVCSMFLDFLNVFKFEQLLLTILLSISTKSKPNKC
jgi:hypothetical protein